MKTDDFILPHGIRSRLQGMTCVKDDIGCSDAAVFRYTSEHSVCYLKIERKNEVFAREQRVLSFLRNKLPVPEIIALESDGIHDFLLLSEIPGEMACSKANLRDPDQTAGLLADGIKMLQAVNTSDCPFDSRLSSRLIQAKINVDQGRVDMSEWQQSTDFPSPEKLYEYLCENAPAEEPVFCHGDYCLPNVFFHNNRVSGFIDFGRAGIGDMWQDIALCVRSLQYNFRGVDYSNLLFKHLGISPNWEKIRYFILLDELF